MFSNSFDTAEWKRFQKSQNHQEDAEKWDQENGFDQSAEELERFLETGEGNFEIVESENSDDPFYDDDDDLKVSEKDLDHSASPMI